MNNIACQSALLCHLVKLIPYFSFDILYSMSHIIHSIPKQLSLRNLFLALAVEQEI